MQQHIRVAWQPRVHRAGSLQHGHGLRCQLAPKHIFGLQVLSPSAAHWEPKAFIFPPHLLLPKINTAHTSTLLVQEHGPPDSWHLSPFHISVDPQGRKRLRNRVHGTTRTWSHQGFQALFNANAEPGITGHTKHTCHTLVFVSRVR